MDLGKPPLPFWRRPPQSNYPPSGVLSSKLVPKQPKGGISTATPLPLARQPLSLPPILHIGCPETALSCSKGSRGLFVPLRVDGIFTVTTISPRSWPRQRPDRYTIRAGRNLPDKEFRYLRTVIVTAKPCVFGKQSPGPFLCALIDRGPFSLSYGANLPSSLAMNRSSTSGFSPLPPVSVYGTGRITIYTQALFS